MHVFTCFQRCDGDSSRPISCPEWPSDAILGVMEARSHTYSVSDIGPESCNGVPSHCVVGIGTGRRAAITVANLVPSGRSEGRKVVGLWKEHKSVDLHIQCAKYTLLYLPPMSEWQLHQLYPPLLHYWLVADTRLKEGDGMSHLIINFKWCH